MIEPTKRVSVAVRVRPVLRSGGSHTHQQEKFELEATTRIGDTQIKVEQKKQDEACRSSVFSFDYIFDQESTQLEVYEESVLDLVDAALIGANATILAYGQTGSGKTHTVLGEVKPNPLENDLLTHNSGMFLRVLSDLIEYKRRRIADLHVVIGLSCVEIYNENIRDLFGGSPNEQPPQLRAVMIGDDVHLPSLIVKEVTSLQAVFAEIQLAISRRQSRSTEMNATSSRSHCLFMIDILQSPATAPKPSLSILDSQKNGSGTGDQPKIGRTRGQTMVESKEGEGKSARARGQTMVGGGGFASGSSTPSTPPAQSPTTSGNSNEIPFIGTIYRIPGQTEPVWGSKILLADLAGSEKIKNSGVVGEGFTEATAINSSLTALGNVVHSLHEGTYVSYRTSNLTRLFKPTFSHPASRVLLLAQVSPTQLTFDETVSTLYFANKVKAMKVMTTTGAEAEKLQFDVIEAEKTYDALLADLHIFQLETGCGPVIHKHLAKKLRTPILFYDPKARRQYKKEDRKSALDDMGATDVAEMQRRAVVQRRTDEENQREQREYESMCKVRDEIVTAYREQRSDIVGQLNVTAKHGSQVGTEALQLDMMSLQKQVEIEEEIEFLTLQAAHYDQLRSIGSREKAALDAEIYEMTGIVVNVKQQKSATEQLLDSDMRASAAAEDKYYAAASWGHCAAKRFFASIMELRESQWRWNFARTQVARLATWISAAEAADQKNSKQQNRH